MANSVQSNTLHTVLKIGGFGLLIFLGLVVIVIAVGLFKTYQAERRPEQTIFKNGKFPTTLPDGFLEGNDFNGMGKNWQGKVFNQTEQTGINQFNDGQRFQFRTYKGQGLSDHDLTVLKIDYNQKSNPFWLRFIVDEIVETSPGRYQGKVMLKLIPGLPFTLTYFELSQYQQ